MAESSGLLQPLLKIIETVSLKLLVDGRFIIISQMSARRPSAGDRRSAIIAAARSAFGQYGYSATTTSAIAQRAGVSEATIFRVFGTKEALFDAAVVTPFTEFVSRHISEWEHRNPGSLSAVDEAALLFDHLIDLFLEERSVVPPLLAVYPFDGASAKLKRRLEDSMRAVVTLVEARTVAEAAARDYHGFDIAPLARIMVGVCFSLVTFPRLFDMDKIARARIVREMSQMTIYGVHFRRQGLNDEITTRAPASTSRGSSGQPKPDSKGSAQSPSKVDDATWERIAPMIAKMPGTRRPGRRRVDDRATLEGIIDVLVSGGSWRELPTGRYQVSGVTCWRRLRAWQDDGVWPAIAEVLQQHGVNVPDAVTATAR